MSHRKQHPLEFIAQCFDVVEIDTSFYGHIKPELAKLWARKAGAVNPDFVFTAKLHRSFTHSPVTVMGPTSAATIKPNDEDERLAREGLDALAATGKLGALLIQFPVSFKNTSLNREYLEVLLRQFIEFPRVVEVRNSSWDNPEVLASFMQKNVSFCNIDRRQIGLSAGPNEHVIIPAGYVRLYGGNYNQWFTAEKDEDRSNYLYSEDELDGWNSKIESISEHARTTFVITSNHVEARAAVNALQLKHMLVGKRVQATESLLQSYPELKKIADALREDSPRLPLRVG